MHNMDIRAAAKEAGVKLWWIAKELKMHDSAFSRSLREELPEAKKQEIIAIINDLKHNKLTK